MHNLKRTVKEEFARYIVVGAVAFGFDFGTLYVLKNYLNLHYLIAAAAGFMLGLLVNYILSTIWVFQYRKIQKKSVELAIFAGIGLVGLLINEFMLYVLTGIFLVYYLYSKIAATVVVFFWNFIARKYALFKA